MGISKASKTMSNLISNPVGTKAQAQAAIELLNQDAIEYAQELGRMCGLGEFGLPERKITFELENNGISKIFNINFTMTTNAELKAAFFKGYHEAA
jgi:hypothetical protein